MLTITPGKAYALSTRVPPHIEGEVGGQCSHTISTGDKMGNPCFVGGGNVSCSTDNSDIRAECIDNCDGSYVITWTSTKTGTFDVPIKIDNRHVVNSPIKLKLISTAPELSSCELMAEGLSHVVKGKTCSFRVRFFDSYGNLTIQTRSFKHAFDISVSLNAPGVEKRVMRKDEGLQTEWVEGGLGSDHWEFSVSLTPAVAGKYAMQVWVESGTSGRILLPQSPMLNVQSNASDQIISDEVISAIDHAGIAPGDYKVDRKVFDDAQRRWGPCDIDSFASAATSLLPRFWSKKKVAGAQGINAFNQDWKREHRIWAHPPPELLMELALFLQKKQRKAEVVVLTPFRPTTDWFYILLKLSDDQQKYMAGMLNPIVGANSPSRVQEWPTVLFHIPPRDANEPDDVQVDEERPLHLPDMIPSLPLGLEQSLFEP